MAEFVECRSTLPDWALTMGPRFSRLAGINNAPDSIGEVHLIIGTNKVIPDITTELFFSSL